MFHRIDYQLSQCDGIMDDILINFLVGVFYNVCTIFMIGKRKPLLRFLAEYMVLLLPETLKIVPKIPNFFSSLIKSYAICKTYIIKIQNIYIYKC